jgi:lipopolysaccharide transport protein LptA
MESTGRGSSRVGQAQHVALIFRESDGVLDRVRAERDVRMTFRSKATQQASAGWQSLSGGQAEMMMAPDGRTLRDVRLGDAPALEVAPATAGEDRRTVTGEEFQIGLDARGELSTFRAQGKVGVISEPSGTPALRRETTSDALEAEFGAGSLQRIRQWGNFTYRDAERQAAAREASYGAGSETVVLTGRPAVWNTDGRLTAERIELATRAGGMQAEGGVSSTFFQQSSSSRAEAEPLHVVADRMRYESAARRSRFEGHARLWQGESFLVEAEWLDWSQTAGELRAGNEVYSVFRPPPPTDVGRPSGNGAEQQRPGTGNGAPPIVITADSLLYQQPRRQARYDGGVRLQRATGALTASTLEIHLRDEPAGGTASVSSALSPDGGQIERAMAQHDVRIADGARIATGERAEYHPSRDEVRLYGSPARVVDASRGTVEGAELTYVLGDDRIQVQGSPGTPTETRWQVRP